MDTPTLCLSYPSSPPEGVVPSTPVLKNQRTGLASLVPSGFNTPASSIASSSGVRTRTRQFSVPRTPASSAGVSQERGLPSDERRLEDVVRNIWNWTGAGSATPVRASPSDAMVPTMARPRQAPQTDRLATSRMRTRLSSHGGEPASKRHENDKNGTEIKLGQRSSTTQPTPTFTNKLMTVKRSLTTKDAKRIPSTNKSSTVEKKTAVACERKGPAQVQPQRRPSTRVKRFLTRTSAGGGGSTMGAAKATTAARKSVNSSNVAKRSLIRGCGKEGQAGNRGSPPQAPVRRIPARGAGDAAFDNEDVFV